MILWVYIILVIGMVLVFGESFLVKHNFVQWVGFIIMLISVGIVMRMAYFKKRGEKEELAAKVKELEARIEKEGKNPV